MAPSSSFATANSWNALLPDSVVSVSVSFIGMPYIADRGPLPCVLAYFSRKTAPIRL